ncbi:MAG: 50S ribosome-binding GTPase [Methylococcaceae bacterium]|nr:50S ribosome-binding GTPase [Methylococcaceae bacterium]
MARQYRAMSRRRNAIVYNAGFLATLPPVNRDSILPACIRLLRQRHESVLNALGERGRKLEDNLHSLRLAEAFLDKGELNRRHPDHLLQIAVIGPTQAGKSSLVNLLLGEERARVSPLAGYTIHPQGFPLNAENSQWSWLDEYFRDYRRYRPQELPEQRYDGFALDETVFSRHPLLPPAVIWDTPDFDSVSAANYHHAVLRTVALADVILLAVSKDKYADQSVWETMSLLEPLAQPTVICLNKLTPSSRAILLRSLPQKWQVARSDAPAPIAALPWVEEADGKLPRQEGQSLLEMLAQASLRVDRGRHERQALRLMTLHWSDWLEPIHRELAARTAWNEMVKEALEEALAIYRRDFLDHPHHYETFQKALAELLTLLEIPGLAVGMAAARKVLTWPVRQIARWGRNLRSRTDTLDQESVVLNRTQEHLFIRLGQALLEKGEEDPELSGWWRELGLGLREERKNGEARRTDALAGHVRAFRPEIGRTAEQMHDKLREHPAVLNGLRATRATTDAAALAIALHTGGIGVQDFIIAPAILSVTSLLAESALGHYLHKAEAELKQRQFQAVEKLFDQSLRPILQGLPDLLKPDDKFNIPPQMLEQAEAELENSR